MVAIAQSGGVSSGAWIGTSIGEGLKEATSNYLKAKAEKSQEAETRQRIALQQAVLQQQLGYKDAAGQAADIFGNLQPIAQTGSPQQSLDAGVQGPLPADFAPTPQGIADGTVGSAHPDRQKAEWQGLEQYHAALMQKGLAVSAGMDPATRNVMFGALKDHMTLHAQQLHANQLSAVMHDSIIGGALDPTDPSTGMRTPDEQTRQQALELADRVQKGDPTASHAYDQLAQRALESHVAINQRVSMGLSAQKDLDRMRAEGKPVSDTAVALADQLKTGRIDMKTFESEWPAAMAGVPGPMAIRGMQAQSKAEMDQLKAENERLKLQLAPAESAAKVAKLGAETAGIEKQTETGLKPTGERPAAGDQTKITSAAIKDAQGDPAWAGADFQTRRQIVERYKALHSGTDIPAEATPPEAAPNGVDWAGLAQKVAPFTSPVAMGAHLFGKNAAKKGQSLDDFLKQWRTDNPKGTKEEAQAAWSKLKNQK